MKSRLGFLLLLCLAKNEALWAPEGIMPKLGSLLDLLLESCCLGRVGDASTALQCGKS